jgi:polyisoprenoid-binding protein YceI
MSSTWGSGGHRGGKTGWTREPRTRAGFYATTQFNRHDFGVSWNSVLDHGGVVVGDEVAVTIDAEAILEP